MLWVVALLPPYCALDAAQLIRVLPSVICVLKYHAEKYKQVKEAVLKTSEQKTGSGTFDTAILNHCPQYSIKVLKCGVTPPAISRNCYIIKYRPKTSPFRLISFLTIKLFYRCSINTVLPVMYFICL
jgi:hypothetical protein